MLASSKSADCLGHHLVRRHAHLEDNAARRISLNDLFARAAQRIEYRGGGVIPLVPMASIAPAPSHTSAAVSTPFMALHSAIYDDDTERLYNLLDSYRHRDGTIPALHAREPLSGKTLTHIAAERHRVGMLDRLLTLGAPRNVTDRRYGRTPLHAALHVEDVEAMLVLLRHGANTEVHDFNGYTPLQAAVEGGHQEIESILRAHGANGRFDTVVCSPRSIGRSSVVRVLSADLMVQQRQAVAMDDERSAQ